MWQIRAEHKSDEEAIESLVNQGFGPGRFAKPRTACAKA
jgi:predicted N-acetyltransferase YhbS